MFNSSKLGWDLLFPTNGNAWLGNGNSQSLNRLDDLFFKNQGDQMGNSKAPFHKEDILVIILE